MRLIEHRNGIPQGQSSDGFYSLIAGVTALLSLLEIVITSGHQPTRDLLFLRFSVDAALAPAAVTSRRLGRTGGIQESRPKNQNPARLAGFIWEALQNLFPIFYSNFNIAYFTGFWLFFGHLYSACFH